MLFMPLSVNVFGNDFEKSLDDCDFNSVEDYLKENEGIDMDFGDMVYSTVQGDGNSVFKRLLSIVGAKVRGETYKTIGGLRYIIVAAVLGGFLKNLTSSFGGTDVGETAFWINYMVAVGFGMGAFLPVIEETVSYCQSTAELLKGGLPLILTAITASGSPARAYAYNGLVTASCAAIEGAAGTYLAPVLGLCAVMNVVNRLSEEAMLEKLYATVKRCMEYCIKITAAVFTFITGLNGLASGIGENILRKGTKGVIKMVPVAGDIINGSADMGFAVLNSIKSGIGIVFTGVVIALSILPVLRVMITAWTFKIIAGIIEPVTDKRTAAFLDELGELGLLALSIMFLIGYIFIFGVIMFAAVTIG